MAELDAALREVAAPFRKILAPGLSNEEVLALTDRWFPGYPWKVPEQALAWWGWQNGGDRSKLHLLPEEARRADYLTPSGLRIWPLASQLELFNVMFEGLCELFGVGLFGLDLLQKPFYPIGRSFTGDFFVLRQMNAPHWSVWIMPKVPDSWEPVADPDGDGSAARFEDWIGDMVAMLRSGRLAPSPYGDLVRTDTEDRIYP